MALGVEIWFDDALITDLSKCQDSFDFYHEFDSVPAHHRLKIVLKNKTPLHTMVDAQNQVVRDASVKIENFKLNDIEFYKTFVFLAKYQCQELDSVSFSSTFACMSYNGHVSFDFDSPVDDWCVDNFVY